MIPARAAPPRTRVWTWRSKALRSLVYQALALVLVFGAGYYLFSNTLENMRARGIQSGFSFLQQPAGFPQCGLNVGHCLGKPIPIRAGLTAGSARVQASSPSWVNSSA